MQYIFSSQNGISLLEVLLCIVFISSVILPIGIMMTSSMATEAPAAVQFTRNAMMNRLRDEIDPDRPSIYTDYNQSTSQTITDDGFHLNTIRSVYIDTTNFTTDDMNREIAYYTYTTTGNIFSKLTSNYVLPEIRIDVGNTGDTNSLGGLMDSELQNWVNDNNAYNSTNQVPGYLTGTATTTGSSAATITNVNSTDNPIFQTFRQATAALPIHYSFDLSNDNYIVKLYFAELSASVSGSSGSWRRSDILINGTPVDTNYSPYESTGGTYLADIRTYPVTISGNKLDIVIQDAAGGTTYQPQLMGVALSKSNF